MQYFVAKNAIEFDIVIMIKFIYEVISELRLKCIFIDLEMRKLNDEEIIKLCMRNKHAIVLPLLIISIGKRRGHNLHQNN